MAYSTTSATTKSACEKMGFTFEIGFVATMKRGNKVYVKGTCGRPDEFLALKNASRIHGFCYKGL